MKQKYEKPMFLAESFSLSQSVAASCAPQTIDGANQGNSTSCTWITGIDVGSADSVGNFSLIQDFAIDVIFTGSHCPINITAQQAQIIYAVCYNNPDGGMKVFAS